MRLRISSITAVIFSMLTAGAASNAVAAPWTFTTTGVIDYGMDQAGIFGSRNANLAGKTYSMSTMIDVEDLSGHFENSGVQGWWGSSSSMVTHKVTVGRVTRTYEFAVSRHFEGNASLTADAVRTKAYQYLSGTATSGDYVWAEHSLASYANKFIANTGPVQNIAYNLKGDDFGKAHFYLQGASVTSFESTRLSSLTIETVVPAAVPEPAPLALFGLGVLGLALARRARS